MATNQSGLQQCVAEIRAKADELRETFGAAGQALAIEWAADRFETALRSQAEQIVYLPEASRISGYCDGHLARMVRKGQIPDLRPPKSKGRIRVRVSDLPTKPGYKHTPIADVHELASRLGIRGKEGRHGHP